MHIAIWIIAALTLGLWSLLSWGVAAVLGMDPTWVGNLQPLVANIPYADLIETWVPGWQAMMVSLVHLVSLATRARRATRVTSARLAPPVLPVRQAQPVRQEQPVRQVRSVRPERRVIRVPPG